MVAGNGRVRMLAIRDNILITTKKSNSPTHPRKYKWYSVSSKVTSSGVSLQSQLEAEIPNYL